MARPVIATKLHIPRMRRGMTMRPRLTRRLRRSAEAMITLVSAPAGFGKTTLLTEWLGETSNVDRCIAWVSLDPADNEPASFWTYVSATLEGAVPSVTSAAADSSTLHPWPPTACSPPCSTSSRGTERAWLVLDDYHLVDNRDDRPAVAFLLEHLPPHVHVVISTRADPDLPLARWRARGELVEVRAADLRFTPDEATAYLNASAGLALTAERGRALEERTEGWIAALQLAALSLRGRADVGRLHRPVRRRRPLRRRLPGRGGARRTSPTRFATSCCSTAVLDRLTGPLCDAVTGRDDGSEMLTTLERANLFVVPLDDRREWYRYHHLFADVLRARLLAEQPDLVPLLHERASQWYEQHGLTDEAVRHALAGGDYRPRRPPDGAGRAAIRRNRQESRMHGLAEGPARRRRPAQPGAERLLRRPCCMAVRRPRRRRTPAR